MVDDIFAKKEIKGRKTDVNISNDPREITINRRDPGISDPIWMVASAHERFTLAAQCTQNLANFRPWQFLD